ncbi:hypothetical protein ABB37_09414 [Leptomonas pyrrhocoris]|uniref:Uncharacterized protein n=1 Tax=Leptomonas pyrrhocoris TaxID=157538 RepID=A0A0M9FQV2_LEPPY|nr:hypothetical protein ABB37_09414 [Leptomonas pyrrhocoris]KPA74143.1 hypothetical protein ABB37_09414 [Leptomonas pyrrhocoris]|eukprot:XP_015652582.1 hypothetical protein ABB37_09414 [Leptomonas pyrrhocoris]
MPARTGPTRAAATVASAQKPRRQARASAETPSTDAVYLAETLLEEVPHVGREAEYEAVVSYVARRWSHEANTALFVCGGCGCGKTSTVKRALRAMSARVLPCDATGRSLLKHSSLKEQGWKPIGQVDPSESDRNSNARRADAMQHQLSNGMSTPRPSHQPSSDAAGLTPSPSLSSRLCDSASSAATVDSAPTTPAATRRRSHTPIESVLFSSSSSPASGRPSASSEDSTASALAAAGPVRGAYKRFREEEERNYAVAEGQCDGPRKHRKDNSAEEEEPSGAVGVHIPRQEHLRHSGRAAVLPVPATAAPCSIEYFQVRYPEVFRQIGTSSSTSSPRRGMTSRGLFGHYVNCADVSGPLLVEAIGESIRATCTRGDEATHALLQQLSRLNGNTSATAERPNSSTGGGAGARTGTPSRSSSAKQQSRTALHVVALDEVEYVRGGGAKTLAQLAELASQLPGQLAFIFISNQRAFVHVPQMMLEALLFEPYSEAQLRCIGADATSAELHRCEQLTGGGQAHHTTRKKTNAAATPVVSASDVDIKPRLYDYIARKALLEYSGDVRQVIGMCHRVVSVAWEEVMERKAEAMLAVAAANDAAPAGEEKAAPSSRRATPKSRKNAVAATPPLSSDLPARLEAAVETYSVEGPHPRGSSGSRGAGSTSASSSARSSAALPSTAGPQDKLSSSTSTAIGRSPASPSPFPPSSSPSGVMTLAKSVRLLQSNQVESDIDRYVGTLPEQTLYVLSCIVVLTLRKQEERTYALTSVGGRIGTSRTPGAGVAAAHRTAPTLSLKMHEVHQLYTRLMAELHFPAMRADGFPLQVECLADFGVLTRPQLRGTDRIFSLNGTWTLQAMQQALVKRGEAIKQDRLAAGAGAVIENKFEEVLRELSRLIHY